MRSTVRSALWVVVAVTALAVSARVSVPIPGTPVPQSLQTLAVVLVGAFLGARWGGVAVGLYLLAGGAGLPVFADGASGWGHLTGPTSGYLVGFLVAAVGVGRASDLGRLERVVPAVLVLAVAHAAILALGWTRLSALLGPSDAFRQGVGPFLAGGALKSLVGAAVVVPARRRGRLSDS